VILPMGMEVDESRCYDKSRGIKEPRTIQPFTRDYGDGSARNSDVADSIQTALRIHYAPALEHQVIGRFLRERENDQRR
jgi:hypothetical protein